MDNWTTLILGAAIGAIFSYYFPIIKKKTETALTNNKKVKRQKLLESGIIYDWIIKYYEDNNHLNELYDCKIGNYEIKLPFLTKPEWCNKSINIYDNEEIVEFSESNEKDFPIDHKMIAKREKLGQNLFNDDTMYLDRVEEKNNEYKFHIKRCTYFQMFTLLSSLEEETFNAIEKNIFYTPVRDNMLANTNEAFKLKSSPNSIGCQVLLAFKTKNNYEFLIQTRSHSIITFGGAKAAIPCYGLSPIPSNDNTHNLLYYNFIKEFCEELYDFEELIKISENKKFNPFWFYDLPQAKTLINGLKNKSITYKFLGFGFDGLNGSATMATMAIIDDLEFLELMKKEIVPNWEVANRSKDVEPLEFVEYNSQKLENWLRERQYHFGSAFTISQAIKHIKSIS